MALLTTSSDSDADSLTLWELLRLNGIVCGMELVAGAALVYLPPMLLKAGFSEQYMSWVLGCAPFLCLVLVPVMGQWMDSRSSKYGRSLPLIFTLSVVVILSILLTPYVDHLTSKVTAIPLFRCLMSYLL